MEYAALVYALCEPDSRQVRYVGCSIHPMKRLFQHAKAKTPVGAWLRSLHAASQKPHLRILEKTGQSGECDFSYLTGKWIGIEAAKPDARLLNRVYLVSLDETYEIRERVSNCGHPGKVTEKMLRDLRRERRRRNLQNSFS